MEYLNVVVKLEQNKPAMISAEEYQNNGFLTVFSFEFGHVEASRAYYESLKKKPSKEDQKAFISKVQAYYDSLPDVKIKLILKQRISFK